MTEPDILRGAEAIANLQKSGTEAGTLAAKSFAALCAHADSLRLFCWLKITAHALESAKTPMRLKGHSDEAIRVWEAACLSVLTPLVVNEVGHARALALFAAVGLPIAVTDEPGGVEPQSTKPSHLRVVK